MRWKTTSIYGLAMVLLLGSLRPANAANVTLDDGKADEKLLESAAIGTDGAALLGYLRQLTATAANRTKIKELIRKLGDDSFEAREKAATDLIALGPVAVPFLKEAAKENDLEIVRRADQCLKSIEKNVAGSYPAAVARLIARKKPEGAAVVLLSYLPCAEDEVVADEVCNALAAVAVRDGKPEPALVAALSDKSPLLRGAAGEALCRARVAALKPAVLALLNDPDVNVRLRVGVALARGHEKTAFPVLIDLLSQLHPEQLWQVEDMLLRVAGDQAPTVSLGVDGVARKKCHDAWETWWKANEAKIDLAKLDAADALLGHTLIILLDKGVVMELDKDKKPRWQFGDVRFPLDVQFVTGDRVLLAEQEGGRVTERNHKGEVVWEQKFDAPLMAQRLPNGNTFMANRTQILEVDRNGKEIFSFVPRDGSAIMRAMKLRNGDLALVTSAQPIGAGIDPQFVRLDSKGKELRRFSVAIGTSGGRIEVLPNGHVLVPLMYQDKVVEFDGTGKVVWEVALEKPIVATRLPNGNTLATSMSQNPRAVEFDRSGKEVWEFKSDTRVTRALRR